MIRDVAAAVAAGLVAVATLRADVRRGARRWTPDSYDYAIRMLQRRGVAFADARAQARPFFAEMFRNEGNFEEYHPLLARDEPEWWALFTPRVVYPALAAPLFPRRGFHALTDVAGAAYVANTVVLYGVLRRFAGPLTSGALAVWFARDGAVRDVAVHGLNDSTALLLWTGSVDAMTQLAEHGTGTARFVLLTVAMSFTRPWPYLPFAAGVALALAGVKARDGARVRRGAIVAATSAACALAIMSVLARAKIPSTPEHLQSVREAQRNDFRMGLLRRTMEALQLWDRPEHSLRRWFVTAVAASVATSLKHAMFAVVPAVAVPSLARSRRTSVPLLAGALFGGLVACVADPAPGATRRTVVLPLYPVFAAGCALGVEALLRSRWGR